MESMKSRPRIAAETFSTKFAVSEADESKLTFRGLASVFGAPIDTFPPSIIERGAFTKTLAEQGSRIKILWQHDTYEPIGKPVSLVETDAGLEMVGRLDPVEYGVRAMTQIKSGTLTDLSIGFDPVKWDMFQAPGAAEQHRILREVKLWEVSVVTFGAQRAATMAAFAHAFRDLPLAERVAWDPVGAAARVRAWARGDQERLYKAFLAAGDSNDNRFQIADIINGKLLVVPGAVYAAALELSSACDLPDRVAEYAREHLNSYYRKMGRVAPWEQEHAARLLMEPVASLPAEVFEGRVLSKKNKTLLEDAVKALQNLIGSATPSPVEAPPDEPEATPVEEPEEVACSDDEEKKKAVVVAEPSIIKGAFAAPLADSVKDESAKCACDCAECKAGKCPECSCKDCACANCADAKEPEAKTPDAVPEKRVELCLKEMEVALAAMNLKAA